MPRGDGKSRSAVVQPTSDPVVAKIELQNESPARQWSQPNRRKPGLLDLGQNTNPSKHHQFHFREFIFTIHLHTSKVCAFKGIHCRCFVMAETENNPVSIGRRWLDTRQSLHTREGRAWQRTRKLHTRMWTVCWDAHNSASKFRTDK